jgi:hypothetical protein
MKAVWMELYAAIARGQTKFRVKIAFWNDEGGMGAKPRMEE